MNITHDILMHAFGRPAGMLGRMGGMIMARTNRTCAAWVTTLLYIQPNDNVLEVGFGPGVGIELLAGSATVGYVAGVDVSPIMLEQARARNANGIKSGRIDLRCASVDQLPFEDNTFDKALAINSMQVWPDAMNGLREIRRVMKPGGTIALGFTPYSGRSKDGLSELLAEAGFINPDVKTDEIGFCATGVKP